MLTSGARPRPAPPTTTPEACWCEPGRDGKCWRTQRRDRDGAPHPQGRRGFDRRQRGDPARLLQHRLVRRAVLGQPPDRPARSSIPQQRNFGQTPFDIGQCRRDCADFRAIEDRLDDIRAFFLDRAPDRPLERARGLASPRDLEVDARRRSSFDGRGRRRAAASSPTTARAAIRASRGTADASHRLPRDRSERPDAAADWLGNDESRRSPPRSAPIRCRALHSNHMAGPGLGSSTARRRCSARPADPNLRPRCCTAAAAATTATSRC